MKSKKNIGEESKKVNSKIHVPDKYILLGLSIFCVFVIFMSVSDSTFAKPFKKVTSAVIIPFENGMNTVGTWFSDKAELLAEIKDLIEENEELSDEVDSLTMENAQLSLNESDYQELLDVLELQEEYSDYPTTAARIIASDSSNWYYSFTINKGSDDGLEEDMNVIADGGLVGIITEVQDSYAVVESIINDDTSVSAEITSTSDVCIVTGNLDLIEDDLMTIDKIDIDSEVEAGDMVTTSSISDKYLPGILIGYISSVEDDANDLTQSGYITPAVDFSSLKEVLVITELKETGDSDESE